MQATSAALSEDRAGPPDPFQSLLARPSEKLVRTLSRVRTNREAWRLNSRGICNKRHHPPILGPLPISNSRCAYGLVQEELGQSPCGPRAEAAPLRRRT